MSANELKAAIRDGARTVAEAARWKRTQNKARRLRAAVKNSFRA